MLERLCKSCETAAGFAFLIFFSFSTGGCSHTPSTSEAVAKSLKVNNVAGARVAKFSGSVTIDGKPPVVDRLNRLYVMAYDPKNPPTGRRLPLGTQCDKTGHFEFNTYATGDGLPVGSYIVLFAMPKAAGGGDALKNLYNDPDQNAKDQRFQLELTAPGKTDWLFDLAVEGKEDNTTPGPRAVMADSARKGKR